MEIITGDLWSEIGNAKLLLVTTNAFINIRREVVMGRGAALEAKTRYPEMPTELAKLIKHGELYGCLPLPWLETDSKTFLGAFQVKQFWFHEAELGIISLSCTALAKLMRSPLFDSVAMNYPGIGNGKLPESEVYPVLEAALGELNVRIYKK